MKLRKIFYYSAIFCLHVTQLWAANSNPVVTNVAFSISGTTVTVTYNVSDAEQNTVTISMEVSSDNGVTWNYAYGTATGNIGTSVNSVDGLTKTITWTYSGSFSDQFQIKIIANDLVVDGGPCADPTVVYSDKTYNTVQIGTQCWFKENLDIGTILTGNNNQQSGNGIEKYCYGDVPANCTTYGGLYQWNEAMQYVTTAGAQGICPTGWHIPTSTEFQTLKTTVGSNGNALKTEGQGSGSGTGTNSSGFSLLFAGYRFTSNNFYDLGGVTDIWTSTMNGNQYAYYISLYGNNSNIDFTNNDKNYGFSIRCLKN